MNGPIRPFHPAETTLELDVSLSRWLEQGLNQKFGTVGSLIPRGFSSYARLFHPARNRAGQQVRWAEVASWSGRTVHPLMAFEGISSLREGNDIDPPPWTEDPVHGSLAEEEAAALAAFVARFTGTPERCFFAVWEGFGQFHPGAMSMLTSAGGDQSPFPPEEIQAAQRIKGVGRDYLLYSGPLSCIRSFFAGIWRASPTIWWPEDRMWCVATDTDLDSTYFGGSEVCVRTLMEHAVFEALAINLDAPTYITADTLNMSDN